MYIYIMYQLYKKYLINKHKFYAFDYLEPQSVYNNSIEWLILDHSGVLYGLKGPK